ncbi:MAG TPA: right-handed parallel beta-helix repeat-containing protein [Candidatus Angelobacter sp.]|nr:right-handed parallel beta-helix repeat-containing protein [Candidatus Angelobacter sp.]
MKFNCGSNLAEGQLFSSFLRFVTLSLLFAAIACIPAVADPVVQVTDCGTVISQPGHYILANDLNCGLPVSGILRNSTPTTPWWQMQNPFASPNGQAPTDPPPPFGILIVSDHVDLALNGHTISGDLNSNEFGIAVGNPFSSVGNAHVHITGPGTVTQWFIAVVFSGSSFSSVTEVTADTNGVGFLDLGGSKNAFDGNTATNNAFFVFAGAITLVQSSGDAVRNNTVTNNVFGIIDLGGGTSNDVRFNTVTNNFGVGIGIAGTGDSIFLNTVTGTTDGADMQDTNANCDSNMWKHNTFGTANQPCIN